MPRGAKTSAASGGRGQTYTLEAIAAGVLVIAGVAFAIQATAVTPLSVSTASEHVENQERAMAETLLERTAADGSLKAAVLFWNPNTSTFHNATAQGYLNTSGPGPPPNAFGDELERVFAEGRIATNVHVVYDTPSGLKSKTMVFQGSPSNNAVTATHSLVLTDSDALTAPGFETDALNDTEDDVLYAPDVIPDGRAYNVVEVRLVVWQM